MRSTALARSWPFPLFFATVAAVVFVARCDFAPVGAQTQPEDAGIATWHAVPVNTAKGVPAPGLFDGGTGVCWPTDEAKRLEGIVFAELPRLGRLLEVERQLVAQKQRSIESAEHVISLLQGTLARLEASWKKLDEACAASAARADRLQEALSKAGGSSFWTSFGAFLAGSAVTGGVCYGVRR